MNPEEKENLDELDENKDASFGDTSSIPDPVATGNTKRGADKDKGEKTAPMQGDSKKTKVGMITAMVGKMHTMGKKDLSSAYSAVMTGDSSRPADETSGEMNPILQGNSKIKEALNPLSGDDLDIEDDIKALFSSDDSLSEEFKDKARIIFESAIITTVNEVLASISETVENTLDEEASVLKEEMETSLNDYLDYVVEEWVKDNKLAVEAGIRTEIAESFLNSMRVALEEHYIEVPDERVDVLEELSQKVDSLEESVDTEVKKNIALKEELEEFKKNAIVEDVAGDLSLTETAKLRDLSASVDFVTEEDFRKKVEILKESYFDEEDEVENPLGDDSVSLEEEVQPRKGYGAFMDRMYGQGPIVD